MSMNIFIYGTREAFAIKGKSLIQFKDTKKFESWQTRTKETYQIMNSDNPVQAYKDCILERYCREESHEIYADDDFFAEREPIGYKTIDPAAEHVKEFQEWLDEMNAGGFEVYFEAI